MVMVTVTMMATVVEGYRFFRTLVVGVVECRHCAVPVVGECQLHSYPICDVFLDDLPQSTIYDVRTILNLKTTFCDEILLVFLLFLVVVVVVIVTVVVSVLISAVD